LQPNRDAKAELNRRSQVCEVLTDTGISRRKIGLCGFAGRRLNCSANGIKL
jgi:hypothetical protein